MNDGKRRNKIWHICKPCYALRLYACAKSVVLFFGACLFVSAPNSDDFRKIFFNNDMPEYFCVYVCNAAIGQTSVAAFNT